MPEIIAIIIAAISSPSFPSHHIIRRCRPPNGLQSHVKDTRCIPDCDLRLRGSETRMKYLGVSEMLLLAVGKQYLYYELEIGFLDVTSMN